MTRSQAKRMSREAYATHCTRLVQRYIADVQAGREMVGKLERLAVDRHVRDLDEQGTSGFYHSADHATRVFRFFSLLSHWKGRRFAGKQFVLAPWQAFVIWSLFGWLNEDGNRRFRVAYLQVGKKNGKTLFAAGIGLYCFFSDGEPGAEVYSAATTRDQAKISHTDAIQMVKASPVLSGHCSIFKDNISSVRTASKFVPLGSNKDSTDGINVHAAVVDEVHRHRDGGLANVLRFSTSRDQPLIIQITTAGADVSSYCYEQREYAENVLEQTIAGETFFAFICELDKEDQEESKGDSPSEPTGSERWRNPAIWRKANPNLGIGKSLDQMLERFEAAAHKPSELDDFKRFDLNWWVHGALERWLDPALWRACPQIAPVELLDRDCYGGLDLAATQDVTAFALYWPPTVDDPLSYCRFWYWLPRENIAALQKQYKVPLAAWADAGHITLTPGTSCDYGRVVSQIIRVRTRGFRIVQIGYDDWNAAEPTNQLAERGFAEDELVPLPQTVKTFSAAMTRLADEVAAKTLVHEGEPVTRWMMGNVRSASDGSGRTKPMKSEGKRRHKIDGPVAALMGVSRAMVNEGTPPDQSVYERRGLRVLDDGERDEEA